MVSIRKYLITTIISFGFVRIGRWLFGIMIYRKPINIAKQEDFMKKRPTTNRLYQLSNHNNYIYSLAYMSRYDTIAYIIHITYSPNLKDFCQTKIFLHNKIILQKERRYYYIPEYGYSYFTDPDSTIIKLLTLPIRYC